MFLITCILNFLNLFLETADLAFENNKFKVLTINNICTNIYDFNDGIAGKIVHSIIETRFGLNTKEYFKGTAMQIIL